MSDQEDAVDHPRHYNTFGPIEDDGTAKFEPIKVIEAWGLGPEFCVGNALKYIARAPHKGRPIEDLKKAKWYLERAGSVRVCSTGTSIFWTDVAVAWGLPQKLRAALLEIKGGGCHKIAAERVQEEIDRLKAEAEEVSR